MLGVGTMNASVMAQTEPADADNFYQSQNVTIQRVSFPNQYKMTVADNLYLPKDEAIYAYNRTAEPKELYYVMGAGHVDLYDRVRLIPFDKLNEFFTKDLR
jgi:fermentation-respiration switch protein FrsA (DUF1100 family)